jgi:TonB family protein
MEAHEWSLICDFLIAIPRGSVRPMRSRIWPAILFVVTFAFNLAASTPVPSVDDATLAQREHKASRTLTRASQFVDVRHSTASLNCEDAQDPQALATPDPLLTTLSGGKKVKVSFIIGADGHVHSPLILESAGLAGDRHVLQTVRTWKYRPATCNGVPTETEGKIEFSSR